jgi:hypothetical protein
VSRQQNVASTPPRASVRLAIAAALALAGAGGSALAGTRPQPGPAGPPAGRLAAAAGPALAGRWRLLPAAPAGKLPLARTGVWTGRQLIIHGDHPGVTVSYRPGSHRWTRLRPGPKPSAARATDVAVWTGSRMLVMGLTNGSYNPVTNTWHRIARPILPDKAAVVAWTGRQAIIWGGTCCGGTSRQGQAYDPAVNAWQLLPAAALQPRRAAAGAWTGKELIITGGSGRGPRTLRDGAAYNPATRTWRAIAPMPQGRTGATAVWDGTELILIGGRTGTGPASRLAARPLAYNPAANHWRRLPAMPFPRTRFGAVRAGRQLLVWGGLTATGTPPPHGEAYTPATNTWTALPQAPLRGRADPIVVWTGRRMIVWGGTAAGRHFTDGAAFTPPAAGSWGKVIAVPGLGALNKGGAAYDFSVSCASPGNCAAAGVYTDSHRHGQGFVADERNGRWSTATEVPGLSALNKGSADVVPVSCASPGNCAAGGSYTDSHRHSLGFVADERNGAWGTATEVPGLSALNKRDAEVSSVSCGAAGSCVAGGSYIDGGGNGQGFVADERNGAWGQAIRVPGLAALNTGGNAGVFSVSCPSAGNCVAGGSYTDGGGNRQGFVADERNGAWGQAIRVPGLAALNTIGDAQVGSVSCPSAGNCAVGGYYSGSDAGLGGTQGFVADERNGVWGQAIQVPGLAALNASAEAGVDSLSCASAGNCAAGGAYQDDGSMEQGFVAVERNGAWGRAIEVPGLDDLNAGAFPGGGAGVSSVSCAPAGGCAAGGSYLDRFQDPQGFVAVERNGRWSTAIEVPGLGTLNKGGAAGVDSASCPPAGGCAADGLYTDRRGHIQGFVVSQAG